MGIAFFFDSWINLAWTTFSGAPRTPTPALLLSLRAFENLEFLQVSSDGNFLLIHISPTLPLPWLFSCFGSIYIQERNMTALFELPLDDSHKTCFRMAVLLNILFLELGTTTIFSVTFFFFKHQLPPFSNTWVWSHLLPLPLALLHLGHLAILSHSNQRLFSSLFSFKLYSMNHNLWTQWKIVCRTEVDLLLWKEILPVP